MKRWRDATGNVNRLRFCCHDLAVRVQNFRDELGAIGNFRCKVDKRRAFGNFCLSPVNAGVKKLFAGFGLDVARLPTDASVDPLRLRMEFLNNARNADLYGDDPLAPAHYSSKERIRIRSAGLKYPTCRKIISGR